MNKSSFDYIKQAFAIVRKNFSKNWFPLLFMFVATSLATVSIVLAPFAPLILIGSVLQLIDKGVIKLENILSELKITFDRYFTLLVLSGLVAIIILTGYTLFIIPGIILSYSLAPVYYLALVNPKQDPGTLIKQSMELMNGHKLRYFILDLVTGLVMGFVVYVAPLILLLLAVVFSAFFLELGAIILILGLFVFIAALISVSILPTIVQVLFIKELDEKSKKVITK